MKKKSNKQIHNADGSGANKITITPTHMFVMIVVVVVLLVVVLVLCIADTNYKSENTSEPETTLSVDEAAELESELSLEFTRKGMGDNVNLVYENGGNMATYDEIVRYMTGYFELVFAGEYDKAYEYYANEFLAAIGYVYPVERYRQGIQDIMENLDLGDENIDCEPAFFISYYVPYENYDIAYVMLERKVNGSSGIYYDNACTVAYTLIKDSCNEYKLLDIPYTDFQYFASYKYDLLDADGTAVPDSTIHGAAVLPSDIGISGEDIDELKKKVSLL